MELVFHCDAKCFCLLNKRLRIEMTLIFIPMLLLRYQGHN